MCHVIQQAIELADEQARERGLSRRTMLKRSAAAIATTGLVGAGALPVSAAAAGSRSAIRAQSRHHARTFRTRLVLLGTAGGPLWWPNTDRQGPASALVVDGSVYLIDVGEGALGRYRQADLGPEEPFNALIVGLEAVFLTHLHSDHTVDYNNLLLFGSSNGRQLATAPVQVYGPGDRGSLPSLSGPASPPPVVNPSNPTPGTADMTEYLIQAYATDLNDRLRDSRTVDVRTYVETHDIVVPPGLVTDPNVNPAPRTEPFPVHEDEKVKVTATLGQHGAMYPSFAFRFDTDDGSVVFSGDTCAHPNVVELAKDADVLVHEVIDRSWIESAFPDPTAPSAEAIIDHLVNAHTPIEQVGKVAEEAGAGTLVLNHLTPAFVPRARWLDAGDNFSGRLLVGDDLLEVGIGRPERGRHRARR